MSAKSLLLAMTAALLCPILPASGQTPPSLPDGPGKEAVVTYCSGCHGLNRVVASGYPQAYWNTAVRMMLNFGVPIPPDQVIPVTDYLAKNFPEKPMPGGGNHPRPGAGRHQGVAGADPGLAAARPARHPRRRHLVHGTDDQPARPRRSEDRPGQGISAQDAAHRAARAGRGQGRQHLVHGQPHGDHRQARSRRPAPSPNTRCRTRTRRTRTRSPSIRAASCGSRCSSRT